MKYTRKQKIEWHNSLPAKRIVASVLLRNNLKQILIVKPNYSDYWDLPGGVIESNESPLDGAIREANEEVGILLNKKSLKLTVIDYISELPDGRNDVLFFVFSGIKLSKKQIASIIVQESEIDDYKFVTFDDLHIYLNEWKYRRIKIAIEQNLQALYLEDDLRYR